MVTTGGHTHFATPIMAAPISRALCRPREALLWDNSIVRNGCQMGVPFQPMSAVRTGAGAVTAKPTMPIRVHAAGRALPP